MTARDRERQSFERMGQRVAAALSDTPIDERRLLEQRARLVRWAAEPRMSWWRRLCRAVTGLAATVPQLRPEWLAGSAVVAAVSLLLVLRVPPSPERDGAAPAAPVAEVDVRAALPVLGAQHGGEALREGAWIAATDEVARIGFSDRSSIELLPGARARVVALDQQGLRMSLESGQLDASVTPASGYQWTIQAGPYQVFVLGTVFSVEWSAETHQLDVEVRRGKVRVTNPESAEKGERVLVAGDRLSVSAESADLRGQGDGTAVAVVPRELVPVPPPKESGGIAGLRSAAGTSVVGVAPPSAVRVEVPTEGVKSSEPAPGGSPPAEVSEWKALAQSGRYSDAISEARRVGIDSIVSSASASDLLLLADSARLGGASQLARETLLSLRERYPTHPNSVVAAFSLGRLAFDVQRDDKAAVKWFRSYLKSAPNGALAEGARGRLLMAYRRLGQRSAAQKAAQDYLAHHPSGRHANLARSLLDD